MTRPPPRRRAVTSDESRLWHFAMRDTEPLPGRAPAESAPPSLPMAAPIAESTSSLPSGNAPALPESRRSILPPLDPVASPGLDRRTDDRLRRGRFDIDGRIDLHGMTQSQAHRALSGFILRGWHEQRRCLLVITGKGSGSGAGVLRQAVPRWLNEAPLRQMVIAIHRAQPRHGGDGALYVLIKRRRDS